MTARRAAEKAEPETGRPLAAKGDSLGSWDSFGGGGLVPPGRGPASQPAAAAAPPPLRGPPPPVPPKGPPDGGAGPPPSKGDSLIEARDPAPPYGKGAAASRSASLRSRAPLGAKDHLRREVTFKEERPEAKEAQREREAPWGRFPWDLTNPAGRVGGDKEVPSDVMRLFKQIADDASAANRRAGAVEGELADLRRRYEQAQKDAQMQRWAEQARSRAPQPREYGWEAGDGAGPAGGSRGAADAGRHGEQVRSEVLPPPPQSGGTSSSRGRAHVGADGRDESASGPAGGLD